MSAVAVVVVVVVVGGVVVVEVGEDGCHSPFVCISNLNSGWTFRTHSDHDLPHPLLLGMILLLPIVGLIENSFLNDDVVDGDDASSIMVAEDGGSNIISPSSSMYPLLDMVDDNDADDVDEEEWD